MRYQQFSITEFFTQIDSEQKARELFWRYKYDGVNFKCPHCHSHSYYQHKSRPEIRECKSCSKQVRLRVNTIFENSKTPLLTWARTIFLAMSGKRGVSALEIHRQLGVSYRTAWAMLSKIRHALGQRDEHYRLKGVIELDSTHFGKNRTGNQKEVLIAVESKNWVDDKGRKKDNAGFAKVVVAAETASNVEKLIKEHFKIGSEVHSDGAKAYVHNSEDIKTMNTYNDHHLNEKWLPWVHRFISNAKTWILGTHHGVTGHYLHLYLKEFTYRFNRRHDPKGLFSRTLKACCLAKPINLHALCG